MNRSTNSLVLIAAFAMLASQAPLARAGDFNHDGFDDLAIGAVGDNVGHGSLEGSVTVLYGGVVGGGLYTDGAQLWEQGVGGVPGAGEGGDWFGFSLATGDFDGNGIADLVIGSPMEDWDTFSDAGAATILYGDWPPLPFYDSFETGGLSRWHGRQPCPFPCS